MKRLILALLAAAALAGAAPTSAGGPTLFRPDLPNSAPPALAAEPTQVSSCRQALADAPVSVTPLSASPWRQLRGARALATDHSSSPPQSLFLEEAGASDVDAVGQPFGPIPATLAELAGALRFRYASGSTGPGDLLRVEIYEDESLAPAGLIARRELDVSARDDGAWQSFEWEVVDTPALTRLRGRTSAVYVVATANAANGATQQLWLDDLTANLCVPGSSLSGVVRAGASPAPGADVLLVRSDGAGSRVVAAAQSAADGGFSFAAVPALPAGASYRLWYLNSSRSASREGVRLGFWAGPVISTLADGTELTGLTLDVDNVDLLAPAPEATVVATNAQPASFSWGGRQGRPGERHQFCLYDPERADPSTGLPVQLCGPLLDPASDTLALTLAPASFAAAPAFGFSYGRSYRWYVTVYSGDPKADPSHRYGYSFAERAVTFVAAPPAAPEPGPVLAPGDPVAGVADADWTLLVYLAADNALDDPRRSPRVAGPESQLAGLSALATAHPRVNIVSYLDGFGDLGAQLCAYPPAAPADCRARAEPNSGAPQTLADFVSYGRTRYPAERTALLIISPGGALGGIGHDETSGGAALTFQGLDAAYAAAGLGGATRLDLVIYQASNLGTLEAARATAPYARSMVAPSDQVWQLATIPRLVPVLAGPGRGDTAAAARGAVTAYQNVADTLIPGRALSMAAYDLERLSVVGQAADDLAFVLAEALATNRSTLRPILDEAVLSAQTYDASGNGRHNQLATAAAPAQAWEDALVDLRGLTVRLRDSVGVPQTVRDEAGDLLALLDDAETTPLLSSVQRSGSSITGATLSLEGAQGLAVFFPGVDRLGGQPTLIQAYLYGPEGGQPRDGDWATLLRSTLQLQLGRGPGGVREGGAGGQNLNVSSGGLFNAGLFLPVVRR
jgi:hypothetical protein